MSANPKPLSVLEAARSYIARGWSVIPLEVRGKRPTVAWAQFQSRYATDEELVSWFSDGNSNLGIVTGSISGLTVIDLDSDEATERASTLGLPTTPQVRTGKGWHFYYAHQEGVRNFQGRDDLPGIDLRGEGGFVVAPPSIHQSGKRYGWEGEARPLAPLPRWVLADQGNGAPVIKLPVANLLDGVSEGRRNQSLARLIGSWAVTLPIDATLAASLWWGTQRCNPPMDPREIERTVRSIYARENTKQAEIAGAGWVKEAPSSQTVAISSLAEKLALLYQHGLQRGVSTGWDGVDEIFTVRKGEWTVVTGAPGSGKSTWLDQLCVNLAAHHDWKLAVFSAENLPHEQHVARLAEKYLDMPFNEGPTTRMSLAQLDEACQFLDSHFVFLSPPEDKQTVATLLTIIDDLMGKQKIDAVVIDPWNELDHSRPPNVTETEHISICLTALRRFARMRNIHLFVVAHPAKIQKDHTGNYPVPTLYDIAGSAHWRNKADNGIVVHREMGVGRDGEIIDDGISNIIVQKIRFREVGKIGRTRLYFNRVTGRFSGSRFS